MSYLITFGFTGESRREEDIHDAVAVAKANGGAIFSSGGEQLSASEIEELLHPFRKLAEEIFAALMLNNPSRRGAVEVIEKVLEGSGLS
jgi:hypothetical protein